MNKLALILIFAMLGVGVSHAETNLVPTNNENTQPVFQSIAERKANMLKSIEAKKQEFADKQAQIEEAVRKHEEELTAQKAAETPVAAPTTVPTSDVDLTSVVSQENNEKNIENTSDIEKALQDLKNEIERLRQVETSIQTIK